MTGRRVQRRGPTTKKQRRRARQQKKQRQQRRRQERRAEKKKRGYRFIKRDSRIYERMSMTDLYDAWEFEGSVRVFTRNPEGKIDFDGVFNIDNRRKWFNKNWISPLFAIDSDTYKIEEGWKIYATKVLDVLPTRIDQSFRDGEDEHCVFAPILRWLEDKKASVKTNGTKKNYQTQINKVNKYLEQYSTGVPEGKLQEICDDLKLNIRIRDILENDLFWVRCAGKARHTFEYINIRENHLIAYCTTGDAEIVGEDEMRKVVEKYKGNCYYRGNAECPRWLGCADGNYKLENEEAVVIDKFMKERGLDKLAYFYQEDIERSRLIEEGVNFSSHCKFAEYQGGEVKEQDMKKGYANYRDCPYYIGFPTVMSNIYELSNWDLEKVKKYLGYYQVVVKTDKVELNSKKILEKMGLKDDRYVFSSVMILFLADLGFEFEFICGTFSYSSIDIDISELVENKTYVKFVGKLDMKISDDRIRCQPGKEFAQFMKSKYNNVAWSEFNQELEITVKKENCRLYNHLAGFFTDYCRVQTIAEMIKLPIDKIVGFKLDGFVYYDYEDVRFGDKFREKVPKVNFSWATKVFFYSNSVFKGCTLSSSQYIFESGAGGCGKTHKNLLGRKGVILTSRCWDLLLDKENEYSVKVETINRMIGMGCEGYLSTGAPYPAVIFVDELTQIDKGWVYRLMDLYPYSQIILSGDIDEDGFAYQCRFKDVEIFSNKKFELIKNTTNYRCKDEKLMKVLTHLRYLMKEGAPDNIIRRYLYSACEKIPRESVGNHYDYTKDWILGSVNSLNKKWDEEFKVAKKYCCQKHTLGDVIKLRAGEEAYLKGMISFEEAPTKNFEIQHAYTIHGFQGKTIKGGRLFFDMRRIFDMEQYYTALSRVEYLSQVVLVGQ
jgi:hypothetical protein